ncbi:MAG TPA: hypothetical protein VGX21_17925 [Methylomirabilota bacterium]|jgi:hypothetical protein|nr:hypothetical protein [Methylomirabilota bacterium]
MDSAFLAVLVGLTSVGAYLMGARGRGWSRRGLRAAVGHMLECVGLALAFFVVNLALGLAILLVARRVAGGFVSLYVVDDVTLLVLSLLQALVFAGWRAGASD